MLLNSCSWTRPNVSKPALLTDVRQLGGKKTLRAIPRPRRCSLCVMAMQSNAVPSDSKYFFSDSRAPTTQLLNRKSIYKPCFIYLIFLLFSALVYPFNGPIILEYDSINSYSLFYTTIIRSIFFFVA